ncbi:MAG TPA: TlpA disulfide reductase family protein [Cyclobacteriaceae bacterium]|nr:TlpA disulfide reductase family protein [Cyclobacteriaceae bacterium]
MKSILKSLILFMAVSHSITAGAQEVQPMLGQKAPSFALNDLDGKMYSLEQFKGKYIVIHFATTWCPFCNAEAPHLEQLNKDYRDKGVVVFVVDVKEGKELVEKSFGRFNFSFPVLLDADGTVSASYAPEGVQPDLERHEVPIASNLIIDKEGRISFYSLLNTTSFDAKLSKLKQKLDELIESGI